MTTTQFDSRCPTCRYAVNAHTPAAGSAGVPEPGDVSVCWRCGFPAIYERAATGQLQLREPSVAEELELARDHRIGAVIEARRSTSDPLVACALSTDIVRGRTGGGA